MSSLIYTYTGGSIDPLNPKPEDIKIIDMAHSLSQQTRFTGHTFYPYTVAQHSVMVASKTHDDGGSIEDQMWGLIHDGSEAYLSDLARPIKNASGLGDAYREVEEGIMRAISERFELPWPMPDIVKYADRYFLEIEGRDLMGENFPIKAPDDALPEFLITWPHSTAKKRFLAWFKHLESEE